ncbi:MAG TPA: preprotein translocase subunit YajC [Magnetospirillaceae bacterium]|nr:preprotein translocase subunit YajC [Magnetospirillaceae bacterium]
MFVSEAFAQTSGAAGAGGFSLDSLQQFLPLILIFVVFYFLMIRPQQKKMKAHREMVNALRRGDRVLLQGGIYGQVAKVVSDAEVLVEIADKVQIRVTRGAVSEVLEKTQPVSAVAEIEEKPAPAKRNTRGKKAAEEPAAAPVATPAADAASSATGGSGEKAE